MTIGGSIFVFVVGAVLYWAVDYRFNTFDISTAGLILMIAGGVGLVLGLLLQLRGQRSTAVTQYSDGQVARTDARSDVPPSV